MEGPKSAYATPHEYQPVGHQQYQSGSPWTPGAVSRFPWLGIGALFGACIGLAAAVAVLVCSDGKPVASWAIQPTVCLAIASAITNILLHFALSEGATIYWWRHSMKPETDVRQLHRNWANGNSLWQSVTSGRQFNLLAAACILVAITPINGPLLQRASRLDMEHFSSTPVLSLYAAKQIPSGYTGWLSGRAETCSVLTSGFLDTVNAFTRGLSINVTDTGCRGTCRAKLRAAGFATNCSSATMDYKLDPANSIGPDGYHVGPETTEGTQAFISNFAWRGTDPERIHLGMQFKDRPDCDGTLQIRNCTLRAATMEYDVVVDFNTSSIALDPRTTIFDDKLVQFQDIPYVRLGNTTLGGLQRALGNAYDSTAGLRFAGAVQYELFTEGATAARHAILEVPSVGSNPAILCSMRFSNPIDELLAASRELIFRTAIAAASWSDLQTVSADQDDYTLVHRSQYLFLGLALLVTALAILLVLPIFNKYWILGREVSMSPIELAKAFMAPKLAAADPNSTAEQLVDQLGRVSMVYGVAASSDGERRRLGMQDTQRVDAPGIDVAFELAASVEVAGGGAFGPAIPWDFEKGMLFMTLCVVGLEVAIDEETYTDEDEAMIEEDVKATLELDR